VFLVELAHFLLFFLSGQNQNFRLTWSCHCQLSTIYCATRHVVKSTSGGASAEQSSAPACGLGIPIADDLLRRAARGEYVDLAKFLPHPDLHDANDTSQVRIGAAGQLILCSGDDRWIGDFDGWTCAYRNYQMAVLSFCQPERFTAIHRILSQHAESIHRLSRTSGFHSAYDFDRQRRISASSHATVQARSYGLALPDGIREWMATFRPRAPRESTQTARTEVGFGRLENNRTGNFGRTRCYGCGQCGHVQAACPNGNRVHSRWMDDQFAIPVCRDFQRNVCQNRLCYRPHCCAFCGRPGVPSSQCSCTDE
jgi:hypothetical protein